MLPGSQLLIEHKTSSADIEDGSTFWKRLRLDSQTSNYLVGARSAGFDPRGVLFDVIRKPRIKPGKATPIEDRKYTKATAKEPSRLYANQRETDEPLEEYAERLRADIAKNVDSYFKRGMVVRSLDEEKDAAHDAWDTAQQIAHAKRRERWPRNVDACERYNRFCDHWEVCCGETTHADALRYRRAETTHEELEGKTRLPLVTTSGMKCFRRCPREYLYSYEQGYRSVAKADALAFGTLVHAALEVWWTTVDLDKVFAVLAETATDPAHHVTAVELMRGYHARWCNEPFDVLAVEREFTAPLINPDTGRASRAWQLGGKIDAIARVADGEPIE
jgi:hypothetical protein